MFVLGPRCTLCGGRLNSEKVCQECGLDNSKAEKYYRPNQAACDDMPLTHVHEEGSPVSKPKTVKPNKMDHKVKPNKLNHKVIPNVSKHQTIPNQPNQRPYFDTSTGDGKQPKTFGTAKGVMRFFVWLYIIGIIISMISSLFD